jgi:hypothetical protein
MNIFHSFTFAFDKHSMLLVGPDSTQNEKTSIFTYAV